jgi:glucokinase
LELLDTSVAGGPAQLKLLNVRGILALLRQHGPCSRADLVRHSGLRAPTVSSAIRHLDDSGLIEFLGPAESKGGRRAIELRFNARAGHVIGVDVGGTLLRIALANLDGTIIGQWAHALKADEKQPSAVCSLIQRAILQLLDESGLSQADMLSIAIGVPGITDASSGRIVAAPNLNDWHDVPLRDLLHSFFPLPIAVENDVNLAAVGEHWRGATTQEKDFVFIAVGTGIGAGIFINGKLYRGSSSEAGEIGYLQVPGIPDSPIAVHHTGQLEGKASGKAIEDSWRAEGGSGDMRATDVLDAASAGDQTARKILDDTALILAHAISNVALILNPSTVVIGGGIGFSKPLFQRIAELVIQNEVARPRLLQSALGGNAQMFGAIHTALQLADEELTQRIEQRNRNYTLQTNGPVTQ